MASSETIELVKKGRRTYGAIHTVPSGERAYLAYRKTSEIFRFGEKTISDAIRSGKAAWALDEETLIAMRAKGIRFIGVLVRETGDIYLTKTERFFDRALAKVLNYEARGGSLQKYLPLRYFQLKSGKKIKL